MAVHVFPVDAVSGAPEYSGRMLREMLSALVGGGSSDRPLAGGSGVNPRTLSTTVSVSGTTWTVGAHSGYVDAQDAAEAGGYFYAVNATDGLPSGSLAAANATNPRIDLISMQVSDPAESDGTTTPGVAVMYTQGVAATTPTVPDAPERSMVLAQINVPKSGGGTASVTWVAPILTAASKAGMYALDRNYTSGQPVEKGTTFTDSTTLTVPRLSAGQQVLVTVQVTVDTEIAQEQTVLIDAASTGLTRLVQTLVNDRFPAGNTGKAARTMQRVIGFTATGGDATLAIVAKCGTGPNRILLMSGQIFAQVI